MTKSIAQQLAPRGITANCVAPGAVETPMLAAHPPERKSGDVGLDAAEAHGPAGGDRRRRRLAALAGGGVFVTGHVLAVNGGLRMD